MRPINQFLSLLLFISLFCTTISTLQAQPGPGYWQQAVDYEMDIDVDAEANQYDGYQKLSYTNNSPDTLNRVFYHLFFNAFQPESMMDKRSRTIADPDRRIGDKILGYDETEIGYQRIDWLKQNGTEVDFTVEGTIMEVHLAEPILPGEVVEFEMEYKAQVPLQTRRSGRDNAEGVRFSMSQWYPKIAAYSERGWHPNPYIGREFFAPFGTFDITIHIDREYVVGAGAYLQNPEEVGYGYETPGMEVNRPNGEKLTWHFTAYDVHDVMWAADPDYTHTTYQVPDGPLLRFFYQTDTVAENASEDMQEELINRWEQLPELTAQGFQFINENYGEYPHDEYMVIQGGDGGMEYSMGTLITGNRSLGSLVGVTVHEFIHAWYEGVIGNDETTDQWIDEGFTVYLSALTMNELFNNGEGDPMVSRHQGYFRTVNAGIEEPMHIHADHYVRNSAYGMASYTKGAIFLHQLGYIVGDDVLKSGLNRFYEEWKFKHPRGLDFIRTMEEESGMVLDWYYEYWVTTTKTIDYGIASVETGESVGETSVTLERVDLMPMPIDLEVEFTDGSVEHYYIPMRIMWGEKENENPEIERHVAEDWPWVFPEYELTIDRPMEEITRIEIDPSRRMADINRENNTWME
ncbi:MAG TPA: M1 family metallopeptidase [Balneolaceae bacterium]|nr:M1 family metallopeptidase [Balneolaceae bacterium]